MKRFKRISKYLWKVYATLIVITLVLFIVPLIFEAYWHSGSLRTSLNPQYVATAAYLFENPNPTPTNIYIVPSPGEVIKAGDRVCVYSDLFGYAGYDYFSHLLINKQRLSHSDIDVSWGGTFGYANNSVCFVNNSKRNLGLDEGIHLFEIRLRENPFHTEIQYEWAVRVEN
jgi:hypothetical protein